MGEDQPKIALHDATGDNHPAEALAEIVSAAGRRERLKRSEARIWRRVNLGLGIPATLLAGSAGVAAAEGSASSGWILVLAVLASGLMAVATSLNSARQAEQSQLAADSYESLRREASQLLLVDLPTLAGVEQRLALEDVTNKLDALAGLPQRRPFG